MAKSQLVPCVELPLPSDVLEDVVNVAKDYALMNGLTMHSFAPFDRNQVRVSRFVLLPSSYPKEEFEKATSMQTTLNLLTHRVSYDHEFLCDTLRTTIQADKFTAKLFHIYEIVHQEGYTQPYSLGMLRSDYMLNSDMKIKQVELNTIASSFGGLAPVVSNLHKLILTQLGCRDNIKNIPENNSCVGLASGLIEAWRLYNDMDGVILFVVEETTCNICDHRALEFHIRRTNPEIRVIRRTFNQLLTQAYQSQNKELIVDEYLVSVVYYRTGYEESAYTSDDIWDLRILIERTRAIKSPSIQYQLAGLKKVQQELAQYGALRRFLHEDEAKKVQDLFTGLYDLDLNPRGDEAINMAMAHPEKYVLKPQREGGGNNIYGSDIEHTLKSIQYSNMRNSYILMEYIDTAYQENYLLGPNNDEPGLQNLISELGIYGIIIGDANGVKINKQVGHVLRTKPSQETEGGIIAGAGALDSPYLITIEQKLDA